MSRICITGLPGSGKTTIIQKVAKKLLDLGVKFCGFYTEEVRRGRERIGFDIVSLNDNSRSVLSRVGGKGPRVGKYVVDLKNFEEFALPLVDVVKETEGSSEYTESEVDEIGKMELLSKEFESRIVSLMDNGRPMLCTVALKGGGVVSAIKESESTVLFHVTKENRNELLEEILERAVSMWASS